MKRNHIHLTPLSTKSTHLSPLSPWLLPRRGLARKYQHSPLANRATYSHLRVTGARPGLPKRAVTVRFRRTGKRESQSRFLVCTFSFPSLFPGAEKIMPPPPHKKLSKARAQTVNVKLTLLPPPHPTALFLVRTATPGHHPPSPPLLGKLCCGSALASGSSFWCANASCC